MSGEELARLARVEEEVEQIKGFLKRVESEIYRTQADLQAQITSLEQRLRIAEMRHL